MKILTGSNSKLLAAHLALALKLDYVEPLITRFNDTEIKIELPETVYNDDVIIVQSTSKPVNEYLIELLFLIDSAKKAGAKKIITVIPYFGYARQNEGHDKALIPVQLIARLLEEAGASSVITVDLHSNNLEDFFNIPVYNLDLSNLYLPFLKSYANLAADIIIVSPDKGSIDRVQRFADLLGMESACISKERDNNNNCSMTKITGNVAGKHCVLIDDIIDSGETICKAAQFLTTHLALSVDAFITHAVFSKDAIKNIKNSVIKNIFITDTITISSVTDLPDKLHIIPVAPIIIKTLRTIICY